jgi:hypothetical protein
MWRSLPGEAPALLRVSGSHQKSGRWSIYDLIPSQCYAAALGAEGRIHQLYLTRSEAKYLLAATYDARAPVQFTEILCPKDRTRKVRHAPSQGETECLIPKDLTLPIQLW